MSPAKNNLSPCILRARTCSPVQDVSRLAYVPDTSRWSSRASPCFRLAEELIAHSGLGDVPHAQIPSRQLTEKLLALALHKDGPRALFPSPQITDKLLALAYSENCTRIHSTYPHPPRMLFAYSALEDGPCVLYLSAAKRIAPCSLM